MRGRFPAPGALLLGWEAAHGVGMGFFCSERLNWIRNFQKERRAGDGSGKAPRVGGGGAAVQPQVSVHSSALAQTPAPCPLGAEREEGQEFFSRVTSPSWGIYYGSSVVSTMVGDLPELTPVLPVWTGGTWGFPSLGVSIPVEQIFTISPRFLRRGEICRAGLSSGHLLRCFYADHF